LAAGDFLHGSEDAQIFQNIHEGIAGTQMPGFDMLTNEIRQLVSFIRSLSGDRLGGEVTRRPRRRGTGFLWQSRMCGVVAELAWTGNRVELPQPLSAGVLATDDGVLFAASCDGRLVALDKRGGKLLWRFQTGAPIDSSPMSYAVDGRQFVALSAARRPLRLCSGAGEVDIDTRNGPFVGVVSRCLPRLHRTFEYSKVCRIAS
jgi:hypothetical protein